MNTQNILSPTNARSEFYNILKAVNENHKPIIINSSKDENNAVIIGKEDWDNIQEMLNLEYSNTVNKSHKNKAETLYDAIERQAVVASYGNDNSSIWGKRIANDTVEQGHRVFHIVVNDFGYQVDNENDEVFDLSKGYLNPIEMFGDIERDKDKKVQIFNANLKKISQMIKLMSGRTLSLEQKQMLEEALVNFYLQKRMWTQRPEKYPDELRIYGLKSETIPKMGAFLTQLTDLLLKTGNRKDYIESYIRDARHLERVSKNILNRYREIFNTKTTLPDPRTIEKTQIYYDLTELSDDKEVMEAQFLNVFNYILSSVESKDVIMVHGLDNITTETLSFSKSLLNNAIEYGVKLVYLFDTIGGNNENESGDMKYANVFNTEGILYQDINTDFGFKTLGTMNLRDIVLYQEKIEKSLGSE
ncbi:type II toxin-antitoxin system Phd/YefM family antitoxin [Staphylococcus equorum]|uniref:type II toxin-antitoxin system Phd/YefM family antitoxin n=1 Tax=Staphylococcus equorum TaxID=246432 RepID=UPI00085300C9|nr:type II toxin-antitoxin system Phd/YefM family antitoxin [Staphylococcus equorum]